MLILFSISSQSVFNRQLNLFTQNYNQDFENPMYVGRVLG